MRAMRINAAPVPWRRAARLKAAGRLCHRRSSAGSRRVEEGHGGSLGSDARQARPDHGRRQQPLDRLGHRQGLPRAGRRARLHLSGRRAEEARRAAGRRRSAALVARPLRRHRARDASMRSSRRSQQHWGTLDFVVHAIAFSDKDQLDGRYVDTTPENFTKTMLISCYSFTAIAQRAEKLMPNGGSLLTLTYYGAEKWMPHYNVMGVAKAALEASVRYLAADLGEQEHPRQRHLGRADQDAGRVRHRRLPLHPEMERAQRAAAPQCDDRGGRRCRGLSAVRPVARRHRRNPSRRCRLSHRRNEASRRARHRRSPRTEPHQRRPNACLGPSSISSATAKPTGTRSAGCRASTTFRSMRLGRSQAQHCGVILQRAVARDGRPAAEFDYLSSPLGRARETMELMRAELGLDPSAIASTFA